MTIIRMDIAGERFGDLVALREVKPSVWLCLCDCGVKVLRRSYVLRRSVKEGRLVSCGCKVGTWAVKHDMRRSKEYRAWLNMKDRCYNPNNIRWKSYGGRGIRVCKRWRGSFEAFLTDVGLAPTKKHSLDRKKVNGHYQPGNVRWATAKEQANNRRNNIREI